MRKHLATLAVAAALLGVVQACNAATPGRAADPWHTHTFALSPGAHVRIGRTAILKVWRMRGGEYPLRMTYTRRYGWTLAGGPAVLIPDMVVNVGRAWVVVEVRTRGPWED